MKIFQRCAFCCLLVLACFLASSNADATAQETFPATASTAKKTAALEQMAGAMIFHASFDGSTQANLSKELGLLLVDNGPAGQQTDEAAPQILKGAGRYGDALRFSAKTKRVWYYQGLEAGYKSQNWSGSCSFWLQLDPNQDLEPGFCDPVQITEKAWNDAAFFVDFDKVLPRDFRLGVFADLSVWNPENKPYEDFAVADRPMVTVKRPPFSKTEWTHVCFTWKDINSTQDHASTAKLYLNGKFQGSLSCPIKFSWNPSQAKIKLGLSYIGLMDDLIIFNSALSAEQVDLLYKHPTAGLSY